MIGIWIGVICGIVLLIIVGLSRVYSAPQVGHQTTPAKYGIDFEEVRFPTLNDKTLYGWWIPGSDPTRQPTIILVHGWSRNVERMLPYIRNLHERGFNLLAFDARHHGSSDPDKFSSMLKFAEDISSAIDFIIDQMQVDDQKIGVLGLSIGGAGTIYAAAHDDRIKAAVTVGAFAHPGTIMKLEFSRRYVPYFPFVWLLFKFMEFRIGARFAEIAPVNNISILRTHLLLIHGVLDQTVPVEQGEYLYSMSNSDRTELWLQSERGHSDCHQEAGFWDRIGTFFKKIF
ncbi:MAG: alpha/beta fold hydrolase [Candidatus Marinimicrobia bacterium]|nr:alpha/beta fold hydrolase [Candidatus Neomarinimicrobiota bacterium]